MPQSPVMDAPRPRPESHANTAYDLLREDLLSGRFEPGTKLRIEQLSARYGIGPTPMREALSRLAETGLVVSELQRGYRVAPISRAEYRDLIETRVSLEGQALARSIANGDLEWEAGVVAAFHRLSRAHARLAEGSEEAFIDWARADMAFHAATIAKCGSEWLLRFCHTLYDQMLRYHRRRRIMGVVPVEDTQKEHELLMHAVVERDTDRALASLAAHVRNAAQRVEQGTFESIGENPQA